MKCWSHFGDLGVQTKGEQKGFLQIERLSHSFTFHFTFGMAPISVFPHLVSSVVHILGSLLSPWSLWSSPSSFLCLRASLFLVASWLLLPAFVNFITYRYSCSLLLFLDFHLFFFWSLLQWTHMSACFICFIICLRFWDSVSPLGSAGFFYNPNHDKIQRYKFRVAHWGCGHTVRVHSVGKPGRSADTV